MVFINSFCYPETNLKFRQRNVRAILDKKDLGLGTLFISEGTLCWQKTNNIGFSIGYCDISLHAISKDVNLYHKECLYIIIDAHVNMPGDSLPQNAENCEQTNIESEPDLSELLLDPGESADIIPAIYEVLKYCQELNPDFNDMDDEDENLYIDAENQAEEECEQDGGDAYIEELSRRMHNSTVDVYYNYSNGNDDEEFEDAD